jgi:hypothetical protein
MRDCSGPQCAQSPACDYADTRRRRGRTTVTPHALAVRLVLSRVQRVRPPVRDGGKSILTIQDSRSCPGKGVEVLA